MDDKFNAESYEQYKKLVVHHDSINLSTRVDEIDYYQAMESIHNRSEDGLIRLPAEMWPKLLPRLEYIVAQFIHHN